MHHKKHSINNPNPPPPPCLPFLTRMNVWTISLLMLLSLHRRLPPARLGCPTAVPTNLLENPRQSNMPLPRLAAALLSNVALVRPFPSSHQSISIQLCSNRYSLVFSPRPRLMISPQTASLNPNRTHHRNRLPIRLRVRQSRRRPPFRVVSNNRRIRPPVINPEKLLPPNKTRNK